MVGTPICCPPEGCSVQATDVTGAVGICPGSVRSGVLNKGVAYSKPSLFTQIETHWIVRSEDLLTAHILITGQYRWKYIDGIIISCWQVDDLVLSDTKNPIKLR